MFINPRSHTSLLCGVITDGLKDNPKELIRIVKNHFVEFRKEKDDKENQDC